MKTKKVILVIVEGMSDKTVLAGLLPKIFTDYVFRFKIVHGDLLTASSVNRGQILANVNKQLSYAMSEYKYRASDIKEVIHLVDLDGVYIDPMYIEEKATIAKIYYSNSRMYVKDYSQIIRRNNQKVSNLSRLIEASYLKRSGKKINYSLYYMSINLDHVIADDPNLFANYQKAKASYDFVEHYRNHEDDFIKFLASLILNGARDYPSSWQQASISDNALRRASNMYYYILRLANDSKLMPASIKNE